MKTVFWFLAAALLVCLFAIAFIVSSTISAKAQSFTMITPLSCLKTEDLLKMLASKYHEEAVGGGISGVGEQIRLFVSSANTFSIIGTKPGSSFSCLYTGGANWVINGVPSGGDL